MARGDAAANAAQLHGDGNRSIGILLLVVGILSIVRASTLASQIKKSPPV